MKVFCDTFYYLALLESRDAAHERAVSLTHNLDSVTTVTSVWVLLELANALSAPRHRRLFVSFLEKLRASPDVLIYEAERELFDEGVTLFRNRNDQNWSLTDCISFVVMEREGIKEALTGDHHFEQAGFTALKR